MRTEHSRSADAGVTLIEVMVVVVVVTFFSAVLISDFPAIQRRFSLTRSAYQLAQDMRRAQDLSLSGTFISGGEGTALAIAGYGIFIDPTENPKGYLLYADSCQPFDFQYTPPSELCPAGDYEVAVVSFADEGPEVSLQGFSNITDAVTSINFTPPNPITTIQGLMPGYASTDVILALDTDPAETRTVTAHTSGLISVE